MELGGGSECLLNRGYNHCHTRSRSARKFGRKLTEGLNADRPRTAIRSLLTVIILALAQVRGESSRSLKFLHQRRELEGEEHNRNSR